MNNEPVAWMMTNTDDEGEFITFHKEEPSYGNPVALYADLTDEKGRPMTYWGAKAHPAKELDRELLDKTIIDQQNEIKELRKNLDVALMIVNKPKLTDEEMEKIFYESYFNEDCDVRDFIEFARAILRKAQG